MTSTLDAALPNPTVYLNYLPPATANQWEVTRNIYLATLGSLLWDMLSSLPQDYILFRRFNTNVLAYFLARTAALGYVLTSVIAKTARLPNCPAMELGVTCCWVISNAASSFLFLRRVHVVVKHAKPLFHLFSALWVVDVGISVLVPIGSYSGPLANSGYCINTGVKRYVTAAAVFPLIFDSLVFFTISYVIATSHGNGNGSGEERLGWRKVVLGRTLPKLSRAIFHGGQQYYLITVGMNLLVTVLIATPSVPPIYRATFSIPGLALTSSMACRVFRNLYFEARDRRNVTSTMDSLHFASTTSGRPSITIRSRLNFGREDQSSMPSSSGKTESAQTRIGLAYKDPAIHFDSDMESGNAVLEGIPLHEVSSKVVYGE